MIKHHEGAISMAQDEINSGQYPETTAMARSIVTSQQQEIDSMKTDSRLAVGIVRTEVLDIGC